MGTIPTDPVSPLGPARYVDEPALLEPHVSAIISETSFGSDGPTRFDRAMPRSISPMLALLQGEHRDDPAPGEIGLTASKGEPLADGAVGQLPEFNEGPDEMSPPRASDGAHGGRDDACSPDHTALGSTGAVSTRFFAHQPSTHTPLHAPDSLPLAYRDRDFLPPHAIGMDSGYITVAAAREAVLVRPQGKGWWCIFNSLLFYLFVLIFANCLSPCASP